MPDDSGFPNSDELGHKGQSRFQELCLDAKLTCNSSSRDRTGWDFIVEFPFPDVGKSVSLDQRTIPLSCHVQVKTLLKKNDKFKMRLSSAERLAKELKPSFVYVLKVDEDLQFTEAYLIHIFGAPFAQILKRLREIGSSPNEKPINQLFLSMMASKNSKKLMPTGAALRRALSEVCTTDSHAYIESKRKQFTELGFESSAYLLSLTLHAGTKDDLIECFLGLKSLHISNFENFETRFGITKAIGPSGTYGTIQISPPRDDVCIVAYLGDRAAPPIVFEGTVTFLGQPLLPGRQRELLVQTESFHLRISRGEKLSRATFVATAELFEKGKLRPSRWRKLFLVGNGVAKGVGNFRIQTTKHPAIFEIAIRVSSPDIAMDRFAPCSDICLKLTEIFNALGVDDPEVSLNELQSEARNILALHAFLNDEPNAWAHKFSFATDLPVERVHFPDSILFAYINYLKIGDRLIGYAMAVDAVAVAGKQLVSWKATGARSFGAQVLLGGSAALGAFAEKIRVISGAAGLMQRAYEGDSPASTPLS
jgi:hypothetical protein